MFGRNTWLTRQVFDILSSDDQFRLYEVEDLVLDRNLIWPGCEGTLTDFGWGFLGDIKKHAKRRIDSLVDFERRLSPDDFLVFASAYGFGPPRRPLRDAEMAFLRGSSGVSATGRGRRVLACAGRPDDPDRPGSCCRHR